MSWVMEPAWGAKVDRFFVWLPAGGGGLASHGVQRGVGSSFWGSSGAEEDEACPSMCAKTFNEPKTRGQTPFRREA